MEYTFKLGLGLGKRGCKSSAGITFGKGLWARVGTRFITTKFLGSKLYQGFRAWRKGWEWVPHTIFSFVPLTSIL